MIERILQTDFMWQIQLMNEALTKRKQLTIVVIYRFSRAFLHNKQVCVSFVQCTSFPGRRSDSELEIHQRKQISML